MTSTALTNFHLNNTDEYIDILAEFNLLFYGYGCKKFLLAQIFPDSICLNCVLLTTDDFISALKLNLTRYIRTKYRHKLAQTDIYKFLQNCDEFLSTKKSTITLVILNFRFEFVFLQNLKNIKIVATVEDIFANYTNEDLFDYNFICRDLTTYVAYEEEIMDINLHSNTLSAENVINIASCVSKKSRNLFVAVLKQFKPQRKIKNNELIMVGKKFLISKVNVINNLLSEFYDHKVMKSVNEDVVINLGEGCVKTVLKHFNEADKKK